ncbi:MAG: SRPBCC family protein [Caldilineaceae bacterium]
MNQPQLSQIPSTNTGMLMRAPVAEVFEAIVNPTVTTKFWFTKGSGKLEIGKEVLWQWEMYNASATVTTKVLEPNQRIVIEWLGYKGLTTVEWTFAPQPDGTTFVTVTETGFVGSGDELVQQVTDSTQGFTLMLAGMKAWLEHGIQLNLVADRYPHGIVEHS